MKEWAIAFGGVAVGSFALGAFLAYCFMSARLDRMATVRAQSGASAVEHFRTTADRTYGAEPSSARTAGRTQQGVPAHVRYAPAD